jgi:PGF-CTERM protein
MFVYTNAQNQTGTVWKLAWASEESRDSFLDSYETLITDVSGGERVDGYERTYTFGEDSKFDMALTIVPDGDRVTVVKAPTVDDLTAVHQGTELAEADDQTGEDRGDSDGVDDGESDDSVDDDGTDSGSVDDGDNEDGAGDVESENTTATAADDADGSGFGAGIVVAALLGSGLLARWRA